MDETTVAVLQSPNSSVAAVDNESWGIINDWTDGFDVLKKTNYAVIVITLYVVVILLGGIGNSLVFITVIKTRQMWNATNIFIANLALADVFVCSFALPISVYYQITDDWIFGEALCHVIPAAFAFVVYSSTLTLTLIAIDRFILIVYPMKKRMSNTVAISLIFVVMTISAAVASPIAIYAKYDVIHVELANFKRRYCMEWPAHIYRRIYGLLTLVLQFFLPLIVIAILYTLIFRRIRKRMQARNSRKTKTTKMLVAVVTLFAVAWTPYHLFSLISDFEVDQVRGKYFKFVDVLLRVVAMSSSCMNPILYGWLNDNYRTAILGLFRKSTRRPQNFHNESEDTRRSLVMSSPMRTLTRKLKLEGMPRNNHTIKESYEIVPPTSTKPIEQTNGQCTSKEHPEKATTSPQTPLIQKTSGV